MPQELQGARSTDGEPNATVFCCWLAAAPPRAEIYSTENSVLSPTLLAEYLSTGSRPVVGVCYLIVGGCRGWPTLAGPVCSDPYH